MSLVDKIKHFLMEHLQSKGYAPNISDVHGAAQPLVDMVHAHDAEEAELAKAAEAEAAKVAKPAAPAPVPPAAK